MRTFLVKVRSYDRKTGLTDWWETKLEATSAPTAICRVTRGYMKGLDRKQRRDCAVSMEIKCGRVL